MGSGTLQRTAGAPRGASGLLGDRDSQFTPALVLYSLAVLTSSFDVFLVFEAGLNFRIAQLFLMGVLVLAIRRLRVTPIEWPVGFASLVCWTAFIIAFVPHTVMLMRSLGYACWLVFNVVVILATVQLFRTAPEIATLVRIYLYSFFFVALFGLAQFGLGVLGLGAPLVMQWWIPDRLPRINGFSYEPSYFATYIIMGWVLAAYLLQSGSTLVSRRRLRLVLACETLALVLCSSRMGYLMMVLWLCQYPARFAVRLAQGRLNLRYLRYTVALGVVAVAVGFVVIDIVGLDTLSFLTTGLGVAGASNDSAAERAAAAGAVWRLFLDSPVVGFSLGGVAPAIGQLRGATVSTFEQVKANEGASIFLEVLAASGVVGVVPFAAYILEMLWAPVRWARRTADPELRRVLLGLAAGLLIELIVLQFNQNILRPYLWLHLAILSAAIAAARRTRTRAAPQPDTAT